MRWASSRPIGTEKCRYRLALTNLSPVQKIMSEAFDNLHNEVEERLDQLGPLDEPSFIMERDRLEKAYKESLGSPACTRLLKKKRSSWNGFVKDKWSPKFEEVKGLPEYEGILFNASCSKY